MARAGRGGKLLQQIGQAREFSRTGALVLNDGEAAIHFLWGQPSHAWVRTEDGLEEGEAALKTIALRMRDTRRVVWDNDNVMRVETLHCSAEELQHTLVALAGAPATPPDRPARSAPPERAGDDEAEAVAYSLTDFPLLPSGPPLWSDVPAQSVNLELLLASLPITLLRYRAERTLGAAIVSGGVMRDGILVDHTGMRTGTSAVAALQAAREGSLSAYNIEPDLAQALPMLWQGSLRHRDIDTRWIDSEGLMEALRRDGEDRAVVVVTASAAGVALLSGGAVVAVYTSRHPSPTRLLGELHAMTNGTEEGMVSILERREVVEEERFVPVLDEATDPDDLEAGMADALAMFDPRLTGAQVDIAGEQPDAPPWLTERTSQEAMPEGSLPGAPAAAQTAAEAWTSSAALEAASQAAPQGASEVQPAVSTIALPAEVDYGDVVNELLEISRSFLGDDASALEPTLRGADHSVPGLRAAISAVKGAEVPNHDTLQIRSMARAMQRFVADRCSAA